jgi:hypothetical protein
VHVNCSSSFITHNVIVCCVVSTINSVIK